MTRLTDEWINRMEETAAVWNEHLKERTGMGYIEIAAAVSGKSIEELLAAAEKLRIAVVPVTSGEGIIGSFAQSVAAVVKAMGFDAFTTEGTDVNGIYEAKLRGADIIYMADDDRYIALNMNNGSLADNNIATASGYAELLHRIAGELEGKDIAVLGYGIIGQLMAARLESKGARIAVYDKDSQKKSLVDRDGYRWISKNELKKYRFIADGTNEGEWLGVESLADDVLIVSPGIPLSLNEEAREKLSGYYINDMLEIGTAAMLGLAL